MDITVRPLTPGRWKDFEAVFTAKGCSIARGCWCMYFRESGKVDKAQRSSISEMRKQRMKAIVSSSDPPPGLIGYRGRAPVGWLAIAPRSEFVRLQRSPVMKPVDETPVWSIMCFVVPKEFRHQGVARAMLRGAIDYARKKGVRVLEAYPIDKPEASADDHMWHGAKSMYDKLGFVEVARRRPHRPVVRLTLVQDR